MTGQLEETKEAEQLRRAEGLLTGYRAAREYASAVRYNIERYAVSTGRDVATSTLKQIARIQEMQERLRRTVNRVRLTRTLLERMDAREARLLILCYVRGFSYGNIEHMFNYSERTFYRRRKSALQKFAGLLAEEEARWLD